MNAFKGKYECPKCKNNIKLMIYEKQLSDGEYEGDVICKKCETNFDEHEQPDEYSFTKKHCDMCENCLNKELTEFEKKYQSKLDFLTNSLEWEFNIELHFEVNARFNDHIYCLSEGKQKVYDDESLCFEDWDNEYKLPKEVYKCSVCGFNNDNKEIFLNKKDKEKIEKLRKEFQYNENLINNTNNIEVNEFIKIISKNNNDLINKIKNLEQKLESEKNKNRQLEEKIKYYKDLHIKNNSKNQDFNSNDF